jgi:predicted nucleotidyltransferase
MSEELEVLKEVARRLDRNRIAYMITGSIAANFYAVPRMTRDIDIVVELSPEGIGKFILAFERDHYLEPETVREAVKNRGMFNLIHDRHIVKVDFVVRKDTPYRSREFARRKKISIDGQKVSVVAPEDLILSKLAWAKDSKSEVQLRDVQNLLQSVKKLGPALPGPLGKTVGSGIPISGNQPMKDTSDAMERRYRDTLLKRSGAERLKMGAPCTPWPRLWFGRRLRRPTHRHPPLH